MFIMFLLSLFQIIDLTFFSGLLQNTVESAAPIGTHFPEPKTVTTENSRLGETQDKDVVSEGVGSVGVYDQWIALPVNGQRPKARYEVSVLYLCFENIISYLDIFPTFMLTRKAFRLHL